MTEYNEEEKLYEQKVDDFMQLYHSLTHRIIKHKGFFIVENGIRTQDNVSPLILDKALREAVEDYIKDYPNDEFIQR